MTQAQLAHAAGVSPAQVSKTERGLSRMYRRTAERYAEALNSTADFILTGSEAPPAITPTLDSVLRGEYGFAMDQVRFIERAVDAMRAERQLAELRALYDADDLAAYDRHVERPRTWPPPEGPGDE